MRQRAESHEGRGGDSMPGTGHRAKHQSNGQRTPHNPQDPHDPRLLAYVEELKGIIRDAYPGARFGPLSYAETEGLWMVEAYTDAADPLAVADLTSQREAELLVEEGVCVAMIPMPLALWSDDLAHGGDEAPATRA